MRTGRPTDSPKNETMIIRVDYRTKKSLEKWASREDCSTSELVRRILQEAVNRN